MRLTVTDVEKAFGGEWKEVRKDKARMAIEKYNDLLAKTQHAASDLQNAYDELMDVIYNGCPDLDNADVMKYRLNDAKDCIEKVIGIAKIEITNEESVINDE